MYAYAVTEDDTTVRQVELPDRPPRAGEVTLRVLHVGVCHTDTHLRQGYYDLGRRGRLRLTDRGIAYPLVMGHEIVGRVEAIGPDVRDVAVGEERLVYPWIGCGSCHLCAAGLDNHCGSGRTIGVNRHGGYAELVTVPDEKFLIDISGLEPAWAATLACSGVTAFSAVNKVLPLPADMPVVVIGAGGVGLTVVGVLVARGHRNVCAVDINAANLRLASAAGATTTLVVDGDRAQQDLSEACGGPVRAVIDVVNNTQTAELAFNALGKAGKLVQIGLFGGELTVPTALMALKMITIQGSYVGTLDELQQLVTIARTSELPRSPVVPGTLDLAGVSGSLTDVANGGVPGRIVLSS
ncbi:MAG: alcohol dehydrogenase catalytic domain-containing protein [Streptosporangiales bacterium]|nr:alcohol dehydrogenase catalytic domain-containing protein [Streptosporangiales bacterium]